jgi:GT2 family glycosyltransferase
MAADVSVIIVNWNTRRLLEKCLTSIFKFTDKMLLQVIVVDNASKDDSVEYVRLHFPQIRLICNDKNIGLAPANNQGLGLAEGRNVLFLNSDTVVHKGALKAMSDLLDADPKAGLCSCTLLNEDGSIQPNVRRFPSFRAMLHRYTVLKYLGLFHSARKSYRMRDFSYDKVTAVDQVMGAAIMAKRNLFEHITAWDENLFFYFEETDLCYRAKKIVLLTYFTPNGRITHLGRASSSLLASHKTQAMFFKSMFYYFRKHKGRLKTLLFAIIFKPGVYLYMFCEILFGLCTAFLYWCLRRDSRKIRRKLQRAQQSLLFLAKDGPGFLLY